MESVPKDLSLVKLPPRIELALYLIKAELRNRKFMNGLEAVGFDTTFVSFDFSSIILNLAGFDIRSDEVYEWYNNLLEKYLPQVEMKEPIDALNEYAFSFWLDIEMEKRKRSNTA